MPESEQVPDQAPEQLFEQLRGFKTPPLARWRPRESLDIDLRIAADGRWYCRGSVIERRRMVKLFGSVLRLEPDGRHYLITPRLKYPVTVDDAPFQAVELKRRGAGRAQRLFFRTDVDDVVPADRAHPIRVTTDPVSGHPFPWIEVRDGLRAKISRPVYYELAQLLEPAPPEDGGGEGRGKGHGEAQGEDRGTEHGEVLGVYSAGVFFPFGRAR